MDHFLCIFQLIHAVIYMKEITMAYIEKKAQGLKARVF